MARRCEIRAGSGWREIEPAHLEPGMVYRLFEEHGAAVVVDGCEQWRILSVAVDASGAVRVEAEPTSESAVESEVRRQGVYWPSGGRAHGKYGVR